MSDSMSSKTVRELYDQWWREQTKLGDPQHRPWLSFDAFQAGYERHRLSQPPSLSLPDDPRELLVTTARDAGFSDAQWKSMFYESGPYDITFPSYPMKQFAKLLIERLSPTKSELPPAANLFTGELPFRVSGEKNDTLLAIKHAYLDGASAATLSGIAEHALGDETGESR